MIAAVVPLTGVERGRAFSMTGFPEDVQLGTAVVVALVLLVLVMAFVLRRDEA